MDLYLAMQGAIIYGAHWSVSRNILGWSLYVSGDTERMTSSAKLSAGPMSYTLLAFAVTTFMATGKVIPVLMGVFSLVAQKPCKSTARVMKPPVRMSVSPTKDFLIDAIWC